MLKKSVDKRVMSVFDKPELTDQEINDKLGVIGELKDAHRKNQLGKVLSDIGNTLSEGSELIKEIRAYKTPDMKKPGVKEEIAWLLSKGYIRESIRH